VVNVWESLSLRIGYAKAVLVGVPESLILAAELRQTRLAPKHSEYTDASVPSFSEVGLQQNAAAPFIH
jgi:hypothetical protein